MTNATVEFIGGPVDGQVREVPRNPDGELPSELTFKQRAEPWKLDLGDTVGRVVELVYRLRADVGSAAAYDFDGYR